MMKFIKLLVVMSMISSVANVNAQDESGSKPNDRVEGKNVPSESLQKQLKSLQGQLEKATAEAALRAQQLQQKEQALAEHETQIANARRQAKQAELQLERAQKAAEESMMQADKAKVEAHKSRLSQELGIAQYKALLQLVEKKQGPEHAYSQQLKAKLLELEAVLATMSQQLGPKHPKVAAVKQEVETVRSQLQKAAPEARNVSGEVLQLKESSVANLKAIENALAQVQGQNLRTNPQSTEMLRTQIADETVKAQLSALNESRLAAERVRGLYEKQIVSRQDLAEQENAVAMQLRRTQEMLEMQKRLLSAENVVKNAVVVGRYIKPVSSEERFDRLEQKLDRIASFLEKLVDAKE